MRTFLIVLYLIFYTIGTVPRYFFYKNFIKDKKVLDQKAKNFTRLWSTNLFNITGSKITTHGTENIPEDTAVLFVSNHQGYFDIPTLLATIEKPIGFIAKIELKKVPIFSQWVELIDSIFIDRSNLKQSFKAILQGVENLKNGHSMVIFPEGTRSRGIKMNKFKSGSLKLASKANVPIVPVAINGSYKIYEATGKKKVSPANVSVSFGKPIYLDKLDTDIKKNTAQYVQDIIQEMLDK